MDRCYSLRKPSREQKRRSQISLGIKEREEREPQFGISRDSKKKRTIGIPLGFYEMNTDNFE